MGIAAIARRLRAPANRLNGERGMALIMTIGITAVLSISVTTGMYYTSTNTRSSTRSSADQKAAALAEAAMNNAVAVLNGASTSALVSTSLQNSAGTSPACLSSSPIGCQAYGNDTAYWWGTLAANVWTVYGKAVVKNPGSGNVTRQVSTQVTVLSQPTQNYNASGWEYVLSTGYAGNTTNCDQQLSGGPNGGNAVTISTRLYVFGNLCIGVSGSGTAILTAANTQVRGRVIINNTSSSIGTGGAPVAGVHIGGGCKYNGGTWHASCTSADHVNSSPLPDTGVDMTVTAPTADFSSTGYYQNADPGPKHPCATSSGVFPTWESVASTSPDNSVATVFDLTPTAGDYTCITTMGQISWNHLTRTLTVLGTMFLDGSAKITNTSGVINYAGPASNNSEGDASLYLTGTFYMASGTSLCAKVSGATCDWNTWVPSNELFGIVTHGSGGQNPAGVGAWINNADFQGALYADNKIRIEDAATTQGPMVGSEVQLGYNLTGGTQVNYGFPLINTIPSGFPGVNNTHAQPQPPTAFSG